MLGMPLRDGSIERHDVADAIWEGCREEIERHVREFGCLALDDVRRDALVRGLSSADCTRHGLDGAHAPFASVVVRDSLHGCMPASRRPGITQ